VKLVTDTQVLDRFRAVVVDRLGLLFDENGNVTLAETLRRRALARRLDPDVYVATLEADRSEEEVRALAIELTVPETYFFRNRDQCRAFSDLIVQVHARARSAGRPVRLLSLGCASGEEVYTLAMLARDALGEAGADLSILGADVNRAMLEKAHRGRYSAWALRETPDEDQRRWFRRDGKEFVLDETLRAGVGFEESNFVHHDARIWQPAVYDVVFCRNVIMYFAPEFAASLISRIAAALLPGGHLFLGHAETLRGLSSDFHLCHTHGTFYYQRKWAHEDRPPVSSRERPPGAALTAAAEDGATWVDVIHRASERVAALTEVRAGTEDVMPRPTPARRRWDLTVVLELLHTERFADALAMLDAMPADSNASVEVRLLRAVLLAHRGRLAEAEDACRAVLQIDELNAGAHYVLALCREGAGDRSTAAHHDQVAIYLDPGFAMPHLHQGLRARREGDGALARRELATALVLLQREDASRLLLFGGGFGREALVALCRSELLRCEGTA
jgi:chemotaxis protein methyltransferase CheR